MRPKLQDFCASRDLFLDVPGKRPSVRSGKKITWADRYGNKHDLDFVVERDGSKDKQGKPVAFIEAAWRRYTKHSRNKAQEIQGAVLPIAEKYSWDRPFLGAILAGEFTGGSVDQLKSLDFRILHVPYSTIVDAFSEVGVDARFDEETPDEEFQDRVDRIESLGDEEIQVLKRKLGHDCAALIDQFLGELGGVLDRMVDKVMILPLSGEEHVFESLIEAELFVDGFDHESTTVTFRKYEVVVKYSNGDRIDGSFKDKQGLKSFLSYVGG